MSQTSWLGWLDAPLRPCARVLRLEAFLWAQIALCHVHGVLSRPQGQQRRQQRRAKPKCNAQLELGPLSSRACSERCCRLILLPQSQSRLYWRSLFLMLKPKLMRTPTS